MIVEKAGVDVAAAGVAKAVPVVKTTGLLSATKAALLSPLFGIVVLGGIVGLELWKGSRDARESAAVKETET
jgi:hypothetical protein